MVPDAKGFEVTGRVANFLYCPRCGQIFALQGMIMLTVSATSTIVMVRIEIRYLVRDKLSYYKYKTSSYIASFDFGGRAFGTQR